MNKFKFPKFLLKKPPLHALLGSSRNTRMGKRCVTSQVTEAGYFFRIHSGLIYSYDPWLNAVLFITRTKCKGAKAIVFALLHLVRLMKNAVFNLGQNIYPKETGISNNWYFSFNQFVL